MVEEPKQSQFKATSVSLSLPDAVDQAKRAIGSITTAPIDTIKACAKNEEGNWVVTVEVVERPARMGDNDLLSSYELISDPNGNLLQFQRLRRYHREAGTEA